MISNMDGAERLRLDKAVFIENCDTLSQHHIDGIRFMYRQYKMKKAGVIINDGPRSRRLQIVLFVQAICWQFVEKPSVLVLCEEGTEEFWMKCFHTRTVFGDDVVIETSKKFPKKSVVISPVSNCAWLGARRWRLLVIDDNSLLSPVLKYTFNADFKLWCSSVNMKKYLDTFASIHQWIYPKEIFRISDFTADSSSVKDVVDKAVLLDAFMEDIVVRRKDLEFDAKDCRNEVEPKTVSKKNKDATGTKIKRTRRRVRSDDCEESVSSVKTIRTTELVSDSAENCRTEKENTEGIPDIQIADLIINDTRQYTEMNLYLEPDSVIDLDAQVNESESLNQNEVTKDNFVNDLKGQDSKCESNEFVVKNEVDEISENNDDRNKVSEICENSEMNKQFINYNDIIIVNEISDEIMENFDNRVNEISEEDANNHDKSKDNEMKESTSDASNHCKGGISLNRVDSEEPLKKKPKIENNKTENFVKENTKCGQSTTKDVQINKNGGHKSNDTMKCEPKSVIISDKTKMDEFENKKNELMEQALKRFKGSVFDSLF